MVAGAAQGQRDPGRRTLAAGVLAGALAVPLVLAGPSAQAADVVLTLQLVAGSGYPQAPVPGPALDSPLAGPAAVAVDGTGTLYVADSDAAVVEKITPAGVLSVLAGTGTPGPPVAGPATASPLRNPLGVAVDGVGNVYVADGESHVVLKVTPGGTLSVVAGTGSAGRPVAGPATSSPLTTPRGLAVDAGGALYVADAGSAVVARVSTGGTLGVVAGTGTSGPVTPGPGAASRLGLPTAVAVDGSGRVLVADSGNAEVLRVAGGTLSVVAGTGHPGPATPGRATASALGGQLGVATTPAGDVVVADGDNAVVERVGADGLLSLVAGTGTSGTDVTPGPALDSDLGLPAGLAVDRAGVVYLTDLYAARVVRLVDVTVTVPAAPLALAVTPADGRLDLAVTPGADGGAPASYEVQLDGGDWTPLVTTADSAGRLLGPVDGLTDGHAYVVRVRGVNRAGAGAASAPVTATPVPPLTPLQAYVRQVYRDLLLREPDPGSAGWVALLAGGAPREAVANALTASREYRARLVREAYTTYLGRPAEPAGLDAWVAALDRGATIQQLQAGILASPERYATAGGTDSAWVADLYVRVLGRTPTDGEVAAWVVQVRGAGRYPVALGFLYSTEHLRPVVQGYYTALLHRTADPSGRDAWVVAIQHGLRDEQVVAGFVASQEYYAAATR